MQQIDPFRMLGRFDAVIEYLMKKYQPSFNIDVQDWGVIFMSLAKHANEYDRQFCIELVKAANENVELTNNLDYSQIQADEQRSIGVKEAKYIFKKEPYCYANLILADKDFISDMEADKKRKRREVLNNILLVLAIIVVFVIGMRVNNLPYFAEGRKYTEIESIFNSDDGRYGLNWAIEEYVNDFPQGKHLSDVLYYKVRAAKDSEIAENILDAIDFYMEHDPHGKYIKECKKIYNALWDKEINKFEKIAQSSSKPGADFVVKMLKYMRDNNIRMVKVTGVPHLNLKDYEDYPSEIRKIMQTYSSETNVAKYNGEKPKLPEDLHSLKDAISEEEAAKWTQYIATNLQEGFNKVLTPRFILFKTSDEGEENYNHNKKYPTAVVDFTVSTQESIKGLPDIWTYSETNEFNLTTSIDLYFGIEMAFKAVFSLPGEDVDFTVSGTGDAGNDQIIDVNPEYIYGKMCYTCTEKFVDKIMNEFGLAR